MIQKTVILIVLSVFFVSCRCNEYYSNSDETEIKGKLGNIECRIIPNVISTKPDHMAIYFDFKETMENKIDWKSLEVYPILNKDTLKIDPNYSDGGYYKYVPNIFKNNKLDLSIKYKLEGDLVVKEELFKDLEKIRFCTWSLALH